MDGNQSVELMDELIHDFEIVPIEDELVHWNRLIECISHASVDDTCISRW